MQCGVHGFLHYGRPTFLTSVTDCSGPEEGHHFCQTEPGCKSYAWSQAEKVCNLYSTNAKEGNSHDRDHPACQIWDAACKL